MAASDAGVGEKAFEAIPLGTPYIPPQCYTKTKDDDGRVHNPCFTCHVDALPPNYTADSSLQLAYEFAPGSRVNPWTNLFVDRRPAIAQISDDEIATWVRHDNYPALLARLNTTPAWDRDGDGKWSGWTPDMAFHFDEAGFDRTKEGAYTGWRAYAYFPVPGGFWPTNGSFGDAMIRLPEAFREDASGHFDLRVYKVNLATLEAVIARRDVPIEPTDEKALGQDLDGDGKLGEARLLKYRWKPGDLGMRWVGRATAQQTADTVHLAAGLFPEGTEFAHSLRYLDVQDGRVRMAPRMKELRYMKKASWVTYGRLELMASSEAAEKDKSPTKKRPLVASAERGIGNRAGWVIQAFIEDAEGELRPQTAEEHGFCIGCHSGVGVTDDSIFSFGRKQPSAAFQRGWSHPTQRDLSNVGEPMRADGRGEYTHYLEQNGAGDELRANDELLSRFFDEHGKLDPRKAARLKTDVSTLLVPSPERALALDKAYRVIVREQSFVHGRDATIAPAQNVHRELPDGEYLPTGVVEAVPDRRLRLAAARAGSSSPKLAR